MINEPKQSYEDRIKIISQAVNEAQREVTLDNNVDMEDLFKEDD